MDKTPSQESFEIIFDRRDCQPRNGLTISDLLTFYALLLQITLYFIHQMSKTVFFSQLTLNTTKDVRHTFIIVSSDEPQRIAQKYIVLGISNVKTSGCCIITHGEVIKRGYRSIKNLRR